jgi:hypothetical protein
MIVNAVLYYFWRNLNKKSMKILVYLLYLLQKSHYFLFRYAIIQFLLLLLFLNILCFI